MRRLHDEYITDYTSNLKVYLSIKFLNNLIPTQNIPTQATWWLKSKSKCYGNENKTLHWLLQMLGNMGEVYLSRTTIEATRWNHFRWPAPLVDRWHGGVLIDSSVILRLNKSVKSSPCGSSISDNQQSRLKNSSSRVTTAPTAYRICFLSAMGNHEG